MNLVHFSFTMLIRCIDYISQARLPFIFFQTPIICVSGVLDKNILLDGVDNVRLSGASDDAYRQCLSHGSEDVRKRLCRLCKTACDRRRPLSNIEMDDARLFNNNSNNIKMDAILKTPGAPRPMTTSTAFAIGAAFSTERYHVINMQI